METTFRTLGDIAELDAKDITPFTAYAIGLAFFRPLLRKVGASSILTAGVYHRIGYVDSIQLEEHRAAIEKLEDPNSGVYMDGYIPSRMSGFSLNFCYDNQTDDDDTTYVYKLLAQVVKKFTPSHSNTKYFLGGLFDGRSSYDNGSLVAVDFSGDYNARKAEFDYIISLICCQAKVNLSARDDRLPQFRVNVLDFKSRILNGEIISLSPKRRANIGL